LRYKGSKQYALKDINITINKGSIVGLIGSTGSGKSTIVDLIMYLFKPSSGVISIDNIPLNSRNYISWQKNISHVPQDIYLLDSTFAENIAFGFCNKTIDIDRVKWAANKAQISDFIESTSKGYSSVVGEGGGQISGGQRQRIGIARALYNEATVIIFDEATSALDEEVEKKIISSIATLNSNITIIMISHKRATLMDCDWIYKIEKGGVVNHGKPQDLLL
jgi:ATP-binding cassette subfamily B protein